MTESDSSQRVRADESVPLELAETTDDIWWLFEGEFDELRFVNSAYEEIWGRSVTDLQADATDFLEGVHPDDREQVREGMERVCNGETVEIEYRVNQTEDYRRWVSVTGRPIFDENDGIEAVAGYAREITDKKEREQETKRTKERLWTLLENSPNIIIVHDSDGNTLDVNKRAVERLGYTRANLCSKKVWEYESGTSKTELKNDWQTLDVGEQLHTEGQHRRKDGSTYPVEVSINKTEIDGEIQFITIARDVSEKKQREKELRRYEELVETTDDAAFIIDEDWNLTYANPSALATAEAELAELQGQSVLGLADQMLSAEDAREFEQILEETFAHEEPFPKRFTGHLDLPTGTAVGEYTLSPITKDGAVGGAVATVRDITERRQREQELEQTSQFLKDTQKVANIGGWEVGLQYERMRWSDEVYRIHGLPLDANPTPAEGIECYHPDDRDTIREAFERLTTEGEPYDLELRIITADDNEVRWVHTRGEPVYEDGEIVAAHGTLQDITERKLRREALSSLHDTSRAMVTATSREETIERFLEAADTILNVDAASVLSFDEDKNALTPVDSISHSDSWSGMPAVDPSDSVVWEAFVDGESKIVNGETTDSVVTDIGAFTSIAVVPVSDYGVFCCVSTELDAFDQRRVELIETLAANAQAVLERTKREDELRKRDDRLSKQTARLQRLDSVNEQIRQVILDLLGARTREAIEETVCAGLASLEKCELVWIGRHDSDVVTPTTTAGDATEYLDAIQPILVQSGTEGEPAGRAVALKKSTVVETVASELREGDWQREALSNELLSVLSIPIEHSGIPYGVITIYADEADWFDAETTEVFEELADAIGETHQQIERRRALTQGDTTEITLTAEETRTPLISLVEQLGGDLAVTRILVQPPGRCFVFGELTETTTQAFQEVASNTEGIEAVRVIERTGSGYRCEIRMTRTSLPQFVLEESGSLDRVSAENSSVDMVVTFPQAETVTQTLDELTSRFPEITIVDKQYHSDSSRRKTEPDILGELFGEMTERQYEALEIAYQRGYFEVPRKSSGTAIAESMDVTPPTFLEHLRRAEQTIISELLPRHRHDETGNP